MSIQQGNLSHNEILKFLVFHFLYRLYGLLLLYIGAFLRKYGFQEELKSSLGQFLKYRDDGDTITYKTIKDIDKDQEKGHMVLIRYL